MFLSKLNFPSFLLSFFAGWFPFSYLKSNWRSFITWLIKRLIFPISWHYGLWSAFMWFIVCNMQPQLTICASCLFPLVWSVSPLLRLSGCLSSARAADCPNLRLLHGGFPLLIGANSFGHLPGLSLLTCVSPSSVATLDTKLKDNCPLPHWPKAETNGNILVGKIKFCRRIYVPHQLPEGLVPILRSLFLIMDSSGADSHR